MAEHDFEPGRAWDEYDWERFLQQQDHKTERYMELLEKYIDDPQRDQIIAREMGWTHLIHDSDADDPDDRAEVEAWMADERLLIEEGGRALRELGFESTPFEPEEFEDHPLYRAAFALTVWIDQFYEENPALPTSAAGAKLATQAALGSAKLAAALSDEEGEEIGMTIAYLKRALKAFTGALEAAAQLKTEKLIRPDQSSTLQQRLFQVRDGTIALMGEFRCEWRRRFGGC